MNLHSFLILPPIVFALVFLFMVVLSKITGKLSYKNPKNAEWKSKAYACGEDIPEHRLKPSYVEFFPVAFFFTIMHVVTLLLASTPADMTKSLGITVLFIAAAYLSILIIFRSDDTND